MSKQLLLFFFLLFPGMPAALAQTAASDQSTPLPSVEQDFLTVANAAAALMKRVMAQPPTAAAEAQLQRECRTLCLRGRQVTPAYSEWLRSLSKNELRMAVRHLQEAPFVQYFGKLQNDPKFEARYERSPAAAEMMLEILNALDFERS
jgi:hypothetical protein